LVTNLLFFLTQVNLDMNLSADLPFVQQVWDLMLQTKHAKNKGV
jgi:hypothetical protein